jgi:hypothetical protein
MQSGNSYRLVVRRGPQPNQVYELTGEAITLGRDINGNDITINDPEVSRHHCRLTRHRDGSGYVLEDLNATNGTFVNGNRLIGTRPLSSSDVIGLGETVTLAYEVVGYGGYQAPPARQQPSPQQRYYDDDYGPSRRDYGPPPPTRQRPQSAPASSRSPDTADNNTMLLLLVGAGFLFMCLIIVIIGIVLLAFA